MNGFANNEADIVPIETVVIPADGDNASWSIILLVCPDIGNRQAGAGAVQSLDAIAAVTDEGPGGDINQGVCTIDVHT